MQPLHNFVFQYIPILLKLKFLNILLWYAPNYIHSSEAEILSKSLNWLVELFEGKLFRRFPWPTCNFDELHLFQ